MPSCLLADLHTDLMWPDQVRLLEIDTPGYFTDLLGTIGWPSTVRLMAGCLPHLVIGRSWVLE